MSAEESNLRESLEAAVAQFEEEATEDVRNAANEPAPEEAPPQEDAAPAQDVPETPEEEPSDTFLADEGYPDDTERYPNLTRERIGKAPEGWRPAAREGWDGLPEPVRREIHRREADIAHGLQDAGDARRLSERFNAVVDPYKPLFAAEGATEPLQGIEKLMQTVATLSAGQPQQKATRMAQLIQHYGVDFDLLDQALAAQIENSGVKPAGNAPDSALDARLRPIEEFVQSMSGQLQNVQQRRSEAVSAEVAEFQSNAEFFEDVRLEMADLMEMADKRGRPLTLQQAYDTACRLNPQISGILARRAEETEQMNETSRVQRKMAAAESTMPTGNVQNGANGASQQPKSIRDALIASIDALEP